MASSPSKRRYMLFRNNFVPESGAAHMEGYWFGNQWSGQQVRPASAAPPNVAGVRQLRWARGTVRRQAVPGWD